MAEPLAYTRYQHAIESLRLMSKGNGFHYDYGDIVENSEAIWAEENDTRRPEVHVRWVGMRPIDDLTGNEQAAGRHRRYDVYRVSATVKDDGGKHTRKGQRVHADWHKALLSLDATLTSTALPGGLNRNRGDGRTTTYDGGIPEDGIVPVHEDGGFVMAVDFIIRSDHLTGDMGSQ